MKKLLSVFMLLMATIGAVAQNPQSQFVSVTTTKEFTDGEAYYTTISSSSPLDFTELASDVRAYVITKIETKRSESIIYFDFSRYTLDDISVKSVTTVPANTGILVKTKRPGTYKIPVATGKVANVTSDLQPVGSTDLDVAEVLNSYVDEIRYYYVPYVLEVRNNQLAFYAKKSTFLGNEEGVEDIFATDELFLKKNTAYLELDYWEDLDAYGGADDEEPNPGNSTGKVEFEAKGSFDEAPNYTYTFVDVTPYATDGVWNYATYYNKDQDLDFTDMVNLKAYIVIADSTEYNPYGDESTLGGTKVVNRIDLQQVNKVPAGTPIVVRAPRSDTYRVPLLDPDARIDDVSKNVLEALSAETDMADILNAPTPVYPYLLKSSTGYVGFGANLPDSVGNKFNKGEKILSAGTVYMPIDRATHNFLQLCDGKYLRFGVTSTLHEDNPDDPPVPVNYIDIDVSQHATSDDNYYAAFYTGETSLDFTDTDQLTAYKLTAETVPYYPKAEEGDSSVVVDVIGRIDLKQVSIVPSGTTIIVKASKAGTYQVPEATTFGYSSMTGNILETAYNDIDVDEMATQDTPLFVYSLQFNNEKAGFAFHQAEDEETGKKLLHQGDAYIGISASDHEYVQKSIQKYLPFGVAIKLPEPERPDTLKPDTTIVDPVVPITIDINGLVANAAGNYVTFISPDRTLDFTKVVNAKAYIVTAIKEERDGQTIISRIDLKEVAHVPAATPIVILADNPGEIVVPPVEEGAPLDSTEGNELLAVAQPAELRTSVPPYRRAAAPDTFPYTLASDDDGNVGFYYKESTLGPGTVYMPLSAAAHQFVNESIQLGLPFGVTLQVNGISGITADQATAAAVYSLSGQKSNRLQRGVNIIRLSNGQTLKKLGK